MSTLPVAGPAQVRRAAVRLIRADARVVAAMVTLTALAAGAGLGAPWLLGKIVDAVAAGGGPVTAYAIGVLGFAVAQIALARWALQIGYRFGERSAARIREDFMDRALALPARTVDRTPAGDLAVRGTTDVNAVAGALRDVLPDVFTAAVQTVFILGAILVLSPLLGLAGIAGLSGIWFATRWYLRRARLAYLAEGAASAELAQELAATTAGARTVEAFGLHEPRLAAGRAAIGRTRQTRLATLRLRSHYFPIVDSSFNVPAAIVLVLGGLLYFAGALSLGTVTAATLYLRQLIGPLLTLILFLEQLQSAGASFARVEGLAVAVTPERPTTTVPHAGPAAPLSTANPHDIPTDSLRQGRPGAAGPQGGPGAAGPQGMSGAAGLLGGPGVSESAADRRAEAAGVSVPRGDLIEVRGVRYAYEGGPDVLHGVDLTIRPGERLAIVGLSGAGKSTLGRLLAGVDRPRRGSITVGGVPVADLPGDLLREHVVLVTQEHHVFREPVRDNLMIAAPDEQLRAALRTVGADWALDLDEDLAGRKLTGAQAQQLALARVVLAGPHTVILDEATALLDPASARAAERTLAAALSGRTVIAIAHRLQTAHDADRIAVMDAGRMVEVGSHDDLSAGDGPYASLWRQWHG